MRTLNKSLPTSPPPRSQSVPPPEPLLQAFRSAALSVTNLYKTAAIDQNQARQAGYQDALDRLLAFLDKENLGLGDGEGWRVRQWATERLDGGGPNHGNSESEDERPDSDKKHSSPSPVAQPKSTSQTSQPRPLSRSTSPVRANDTGIHWSNSSTQPHNNLQSRPEAFTFRSEHQYPAEMDIQPIETPLNSSPEADSSLIQPSIRVEILSRSRNQTRHSSYPGRPNTRSATTLRSLGPGAGSKRRVASGDLNFFDFDTLGDGRDATGGSGKRSRLI